ncbi:MAG: hypothetical protein ACTHLD_19585, partial [Chitinophaga sp.]
MPPFIFRYFHILPLCPEATKKRLRLHYLQLSPFGRNLCGVKQLIFMKHSTLVLFISLFAGAF